MRLYRLAGPRFRLDDPSGAALHPGRWNATGQRVLYASASFAGAILAQLAHSAIGRLPPRQWCTIESPDSCTVERREARALPEGWDRPDDYAVARAIGAEWYAVKSSCVLFVPSLTGRPVEWNAVIHTVHADFATIAFGPPRALEWDPRLG